MVLFAFVGKYSNIDCLYEVKRVTMWRVTMWTSGILLVADILEEHRSLTNLFRNGNPLIWGGLGWCVLLVFLAKMGYPLIVYVGKYLKICSIKKACKRKKEENRVKLNRVQLNKEKNDLAYEKKKEELEIELNQNEELKNNLMKCAAFYINAGKDLEKNVEKLNEAIENSNNSIKELKEKRKLEKEKY